MRTTVKLGTATLGSALLLTLGAGMAQAASASDGNTMAKLRPVALNGVKANGTAMVTVNGNKINVTMAARGLLADSPHAAHIHFGADARHECPTAADDKDGGGTLNTTEGGPAYGPIVVSLTKTGDTSPDSALAVDRFDAAKGGKINYERGSITVSSDVAAAISSGKSVVVVHGVDHNHNGKYDGETMSELDPKLPTEATDPAICGVLASAPAGGVQTGGGGTADNNQALGLALGGGFLLAAMGTGAFATRKVTNRI
ncbi:MAG: CHRD domain-containing protein [Knoellia sp.]